MRTETSTSKLRTYEINILYVTHVIRLVGFNPIYVRLSVCVFFPAWLGPFLALVPIIIWFDWFWTDWKRGRFSFFLFWTLPLFNFFQRWHLIEKKINRLFTVLFEKKRGKGKFLFWILPTSEPAQKYTPRRLEILQGAFPSKIFALLVLLVFFPPFYYQRTPKNTKIFSNPFKFITWSNLSQK